MWCDITKFGNWVPIFWKNILPTSSIFTVDGDHQFLWNVDTHLPNYMVSNLIVIFILTTTRMKNLTNHNYLWTLLKLAVFPVTKCLFSNTNIPMMWMRALPAWSWSLIWLAALMAFNRSVRLLFWPTYTNISFPASKIKQSPLFIDETSRFT